MLSIIICRMLKLIIMYQPGSLFIYQVADGSILIRCLPVIEATTCIRDIRLSLTGQGHTGISMMTGRGIEATAAIIHR